MNVTPLTGFSRHLFFIVLSLQTDSFIELNQRSHILLQLISSFNYSLVLLSDLSSTLLSLFHNCYVLLSVLIYNEVLGLCKAESSGNATDLFMFFVVFKFFFENKSTGLNRFYSEVSSTKSKCFSFLFLVKIKLFFG